MNNMKTYINGLLFLAILLGAGTVLAGSDLDRQIKGVLDDITRYEKQFVGKSDVNRNTVKRTLKLLGLTRQRLDGVADKSSPAWKDADARYTILYDQLNRLLKPSGSPQPSSAAKPPTPSADKQSAATSKTMAPQEMISQHQTRVKKIKRDADSVFETIDKGGIKPFQDPKYVQKYQKALDRFKEAMKKYDEFSTHPTVVEAQQSITKLENMITFGQQRAQKDLETLGDVQSRLRTIHASTKKLKVPAMPQIPVKKGEIARWIAGLGTVRQTAIQTYQPLPQIKKIAYLPNTRFTVEQTGTYEMDDVDRLDRALRGIVSQVDASLKKFSDHLRLNVAEVAKMLPIYQGYDPTKEEDRLKHFLYEGRADQIKRSLDTHHTLMSEALIFSQQLKTKDHDAWKKLLAQVEQVTEEYEANFQKALSLARMPKPVSHDAKLLAIARKVLTNPMPAGYDKVGDVKRIVITSKKVHRANDVTHETFDKFDVKPGGNITMSGTAVTNHFEWDEFKVVTAEAIGGKHYIYYNSLAYYTEGGQRTRLNQWMITSRLKGAEIQERNINVE